jgi:TonB family protein
VPPRYPNEAVKIKAQGYVILGPVLRTDGTIDDIVVLRKLLDGKYGFEREAIAALERWSFIPGQLDGKPVNVHMTLKIEFILY